MVTKESATIRLNRIVNLVRKMRGFEVDYYYHHVGTAGPKMRKCQREVDELVKQEMGYLKSKQLDLL